jgi:hypothetical protein
MPADVAAARRTGEEVTLCETLCRKPNVVVSEDISELDTISAMTSQYEELVVPVMWIAPWLRDRHPLVAATTVLHELDHAFWGIKPKLTKKQVVSFTDHIAEMEVSAYRLEQAILQAAIPELYAEERQHAKETLRAIGLDREYKPRCPDKLRKAARVTAYINGILDEFDAKPMQTVDPELVRVMRIQKLM